jgi:hypothetical protein
MHRHLKKKREYEEEKHPRFRNLEIPTLHKLYEFQDVFLFAGIGELTI